MPDRGARFGDKAISQINRKLRTTYRTAQRELAEKLRDFNRRFAEKDKAQRERLREGKISQQDYKNWLAGQVFMRNQWESKIRQVNSVMLDYNRQAMRIVNEGRLSTFAENYYSEAFKAQWIVNDISFNVYNTQAIAELLANNPQILPEWKIDEEKDYDWNYQKVNNIIKQGIIQGEGVDEITQRLCNDLCTQNENKMRMFARTGVTEAQNAGRQIQMEQAADMGIEIHKRWVATMDSRTRDVHRALDGQEVPYNEMFESDLGEIEYPGDPGADPANVYNCRCTMESVYPEYEDRSKKWREDVTIDGEPYEEWKENKKNATIDDFKGATTAGALARRIEKAADIRGIEPIAFKKHGEKLSNKEIINRISEYDKTLGSCASVAFAYIANKAGWDVKDFRGGESQNYFGMDSTIKSIARLDGVRRFFYFGKNDFSAYNKLMSKAEPGKEYLLSVGRHVSIVKRMEKSVKYLELQGKEGTNGYHDLTQTALEYQFGCESIHRDYEGNPSRAQSVLIDIETLMKNADFLDIMRYINIEH